MLGELVSVVVDVRPGEESRVGPRMSSRSGDGTPIIIARPAWMEPRTTFQALRGTRIDLGENADIGNGNVIHGPVNIGDNVISEDNDQTEQ